jgi:NAD(P)H-binding
MKRTSVRRILVLSVGFLFPETGLPGAALRRVFLRNVGKHAAAMKSILMREPLDWTIVRPPRLTNAKLSGNYRVMDDRMPKRGFIIPRADVADFLLNEAENPPTSAESSASVNKKGQDYPALFLPRYSNRVHSRQVEHQHFRVFYSGELQRVLFGNRRAVSGLQLLAVELHAAARHLHIRVTIRADFMLH